jgi:hypothetical protein
MPITPRLVRAAALALSATLSAVWAATPDPTYQALRQATVGDMLLVENIVLRRDVGTLTLKNGVIGLTAPVKGRDTIAVFSGEAEFTLTPATAIEKSYLKSLTEQESVKESFDRALFCFTDDTGKEIRSQAKTRPADPKLSDILGDYRRRLRKESNDNIEAEILADLYNESSPGSSAPTFTGASTTSFSSTSSRAAPNPRSVPRRSTSTTFNLWVSPTRSGITPTCKARSRAARQARTKTTDR